MLIGADIRLYREGLGQLLDRVDEFEVVGAVASGEEALARIANTTPDIVLIDLGMPGSIAVMVAIRDTVPSVRLVAFAAAEVDDVVVACAEAGAVGYVSRDASADELIAVLRGVFRGEAPCSPRVTATLFRRLAALSGGRQTQLAFTRLTGRECEIVRLVDRGLSNKEIATELGIEVATVKNHVHNILEKLDVHRRGEAAARLRGSQPPFTGQTQHGVAPPIPQPRVGGAR